MEYWLIGYVIFSAAFVIAAYDDVTDQPLLVAALALFFIAILWPLLLIVKIARVILHA